MSEKRTPEEEGKNLEDFVEDMKLEREAARLGTRTRREVQASYKLSPEQREKARALGRRAKEAYAEADAQAHVPLRPRAPRGILAPIAAATALLGPVGYLVLEELVTPLALVASGHDAGAERLEAAALRAEAADALEAGQWARCITLLDEAKRKDPDGEAAPRVKDMRRRLEIEGGVDGAGP